MVIAYLKKSVSQSFLVLKKYYYDDTFKEALILWYHNTIKSILSE